MGWEKIYTVTAPIDEPAEGAELDWEEESLHGEELVAAYDDEWPACPRVLLREGTVEPTSLTVILAASRTNLMVIDYTDAATAPVPPRGRAHLRRREGSSYDEAHIYVNPAYAGLILRVDYRYYPAAGEARAFLAAADGLHFAAEEPGRWQSWDGATAANGDVVKLGEDGPAFVAGGAVGEAWALTYPGGILARRGCQWSGWLEVDGAEMAGLAYLGALAQAAAAKVDLTPADRLVFGSPETAGVFDLPRAGILKIKAEPTAAAACAVELTYRGGRVRSGEGGWVYRFDNPLVSSRAHARLICDELAQRLAARGTAITATATDPYYFPPGTLIRLETAAKKSALHLVAAARRDLMNGTVELTLVAVARPTGEEAAV